MLGESHFPPLASMRHHAPADHRYVRYDQIVLVESTPT
jgi:hypothetical protein